MKHYLMKKRIVLFIYLSIIAFCAIFIRLGYISFKLSGIINPRAYDLWSREIPVNSGRGKIYDRNGNLIVGNKLTLSLASINKQVKDKVKTARILSELLECSFEKILAHLNKNVSVELIKPEGRKLDVEVARKINDLGIDGIYIVSDTSRYYPYGQTLAATLGFVGIDNDGLAGVEYIYNDYLKSKNGSLNVYTDAKGNIMPDMTSYYTSSNSGFDIYLTVDIEVQNILDNVINNAVARYNPDQVIGLVTNVKTGEILGMTSYPGFDPENYQDYDQSIYNRNLPIWMSFEPGSTFKFVTYSAGLEEKVFNLNEGFYDPGYRIVAGTRIRDWKAGGHGQETFLEVLQNSCNPGFMAIGERLGTDKLFGYIDAYGFGKKTGVDLLGESTGIVFNKNNVGPLELATSSFGEVNYRITPNTLTLKVLYRLYKLHIVS